MKTSQLTQKIGYALVSFALCTNGLAATTDLSNVPLVTSSAASVRPNLMFILDDSGSMAWDFMPSEAANFADNDYGYNSNHCNGVYYDPNVTYTPPVDSSGTSFPNSSFTAAWRDGYNTGAGTVNLDTGFTGGSGSGATGIALTPGPAFYYTYSGTQTTAAQKDYLNTSSIFYKECNSNIGSTTVFDGTNPVNTLFTKTTFNSSTSPAAQLTNFANWYSYYSHRMLMMKTGAGLAFKPLDDNYRVGFLTINNNNSPDFVENAPFSAGCAVGSGLCQKDLWYSKLYAASPNNSTPLRESLANVGKYYAHKFGTFTSYNATIVVSGSVSTTVSSITVNGTEIMAGTSTASSSNSTIASNVKNQINLVDPSDYGASSSGSTITIKGPVSALGAVPVVTQSGGATFTISAFTAVTTTGTLNGITPADPVEYSCQQNFAILSTDGYWNGNTGTRLLGGTMGNQDGTEPRPLFDGSNNAVQTVTPTTTVVRTQSIQNQTITTPWTRTITTVGAACSTPDTPPANSVSAYLDDNSEKIALGLSATSPNVTNCIQLGTGSGAGTAWMCHGTGGGAPPVTQSTVTDSTGTPWYLVSQGSNLPTATCQRDRGAFGSSYSKQKGACSGTAGVAGSNVTVDNQSYSQVLVGDTTTVQDSTTIVTSTVVTTNGIAGPTTTTTSGPTISTVSTSTVPSSDTGAPNGSTVWTSSAITSCVASPPASSTTSPVAGSVLTTNNGSPANTTVFNTTTTGTPVVTTSASGGTSDTLADVAEYYYITDLRDATLGNNIGVLGGDVATNNVPGSGLDSASFQHMTTFTLGLGARGRMVFSPTYQSDTSGDFFSVKNGSAANPPSICSWQASGSGACNWPTPSSGSVANIDDLWHAAVNGRGTYFSATDPSSLSSGLSSALAGVSARTGASAAATTSNPNVTSGDNFVFSSTFTTQAWDGELVRQQLDLATGVTSATIDWTAQAPLDVNASRTIYMFDSGGTNNLKTFTWANLTTTEKAFFEVPAISTAGTGLTQFLCADVSICLSGGDQTLAAGSNLVSFLRGDRTNEGIATDNTKYYRQRLHLLGDIVNAEAVYVKGSLTDYADFGHDAFVTTVATRQGMVYAAANDGMLHAFYAADGAPGIVGGEEAWAYIPSFVIPNLYHLADKNYTANHRYFVDGTPLVGEICVSSCTSAAAVWKTILVGGLNGGGQGYYALDITDPATPVALWEFTDTDMGYTYGNPQITKLRDGTWVVLVTSGYNNVGGDGGGHLYVIDAATGSLIRTINTGVGDTTTPSGLAKISASVVNPSTDNTATQVYGGDLLGNLWRFDVNGDLGPVGYEAQLLVALKDGSSNAQPITIKPEIGIVDGHTVVYVGTGRYLGATDNANTDQQTLYGIRDETCFTLAPALPTCSVAELAQVPGTAIYSNPRSDSNFIQQTQTQTTCPAGSPATICTTGQIVLTSSNNPVDINTNFGWFIDLVETGERANTDPVLALGTLGFTTNAPNTSACTIGGVSFNYFLDYRTGAAVSSSTTNVVGTKLGNALATRPVYVRLPNNKIVQLTRLSDGTTLTTNVPIGASGLPTRRTSWRELTN